MTYKDHIDFYYNKKKNDYELKDNLSLYQHFLVEEGLAKINKIFDNNINNQIIVNETGINRFHPNKINNKEFWNYAKLKFPLFSVSGSPSINIKDCNKKTLELSKILGLYSFMIRKIYKSKQKLNILEIGYGYGNVFEKINKLSNYIGIDFSKIKQLNKYNNLIIINKSGIPEIIKDNSMDIVYSVNVLQHCSQKDRFNYISESYKKLIKGGYFIGSCFVETDINKNSDVWGIQDENERKYCHFFKQLVEVDRELELRSLFNKLGFKIIKFDINYVNLLSFILKK